MNRRSPVAPSTAAASYSSSGIAMRPASRITVQNGSHFQIYATVTEPIARPPWSSHGGPSAWNKSHIVLLMSPTSRSASSARR